VVSVYRAAAEAKGLRLDAKFDAHLGATSSNRLKTKQIAVNLLSNALKYTQSGAIGLTMTALGADHWRLTVTDTGIGISPSDQARVFKEFERAAGSDTPGVGLGLAIVKELVRSLGGEIRLESRTDVGSVFEVRLPLQVSLMAAG
jgi:signal transduction histidine kinase